MINDKNLKHVMIAIFAFAVLCVAAEMYFDAADKTHELKLLEIQSRKAIFRDSLNQKYFDEFWHTHYVDDDGVVHKSTK